MAHHTPTLDELLALRERLPEPAERQSIRERLGLSRELVARELGVTQDALYQWEKGRAEPRAVNLAAYVELLERLQAMSAPPEVEGDDYPEPDHLHWASDDTDELGGLSDA